MDEKTVTIRFKADQATIDSLVTSWLHNEGVTIRHGGGTITTDLTYVKEQ